MYRQLLCAVQQEREVAMTVIQSIVFFIASFLASVAGAICGIGGGVIVKPTLELFGWVSAATISFLSGTMVLAMSCYSVTKSLRAKEKKVDMKTGTPLALGAAIGGVAGKWVFNWIRTASGNPDTVGCVQSVCLLLVTVGTLIYNLKKAGIRTHRVSNGGSCVIIGLALGLMSSFLGIGGGPINLVVLSFFFSMDTKIAAANSLYIILFSQLASLLYTVLGGSLPEFDWFTLGCMILGGIFGGMAGRKCSARMNNAGVDKLLTGLMAVIILMSAYNAWRYAM